MMIFKTSRFTLSKILVFLIVCSYLVFSFTGLGQAKKVRGSRRKSKKYSTSKASIQKKSAQKDPVQKAPKRKGSLQDQVISMINADSAMRGVKVGVYAISLSHIGKPLVNINANELFIPASNQKLFISAAALAKLGPDFSFPTEIYADNLLDGVVNGHLYIKGFGDPSFSNEQMEEIAQQIKSAGVKNIIGNIIFDDSYFIREDKNSGGTDVGKSPLWYKAESAALPINFNTIRILIRPGLRSGQKPSVELNPDTDFINIVNRGLTCSRPCSSNISVNRLTKEGKNTFVISGKIPVNHSPVTVCQAVKYPSCYTAEVLKAALVKSNIKIAGVVRSGLVPEGATLIYRHQSKPLADIITRLNKTSNNFIAEQLLKTLGAEIKGVPGTSEKGLSVINDFLCEAGVGTDGFFGADGCGLSRKNLTSPKSVVSLLTYMQQKCIHQDEYISSLPIGGVDGTLKRRLKKSNVYKKVRAKTGFINGVSCLSGYAYSNHNGIIAFSILMNGKKNKPPMCKLMQDKIVSIFMDYQG